MKKKILIAILIAVMMMSLCACSGKNAFIGHWRIKSVSAGDITMEQSDIEDMGLNPGYLQLKKSGKAELNLLGDEFTGTWKMADDGTAVVTYGDNLKGTATKTEKGIDFKDAQGSEYKMERF